PSGTVRRRCSWRRRRPSQVGDTESRERSRQGYVIPFRPPGQRDAPAPGSQHAGRGTPTAVEVPLRRRPVLGTGAGGDQSVLRPPTLGVFFWTVIRNSVFDWVFFTRSMSSSSACCCSREPSTRRSFHLMASSSLPISASS